MGILGSVVRGVVGLATLLLVIGLIAYWADYSVDATVTKKVDTGSSCEITVKTKMLGITHTMKDLDAQTCFAVHEGNFVTYHIRSKHTTLFESQGGNCIYDSITGPMCPKAAAP
jgi:hypothetical protein